MSLGGLWGTQRAEIQLASFLTAPWDHAPNFELTRSLGYDKVGPVALITGKELWCQVTPYLGPPPMLQSTQAFYCRMGLTSLGFLQRLLGTTLAHMWAIIRLFRETFWENLLGVRPWGYNPRTLDSCTRSRLCWTHSRVQVVRVGIAEIEVHLASPL